MSPGGDTGAVEEVDEAWGKGGGDGGRHVGLKGVRRQRKIGIGGIPPPPELKNPCPARHDHPLHPRDFRRAHAAARWLVSTIISGIHG